MAKATSLAFNAVQRKIKSVVGDPSNSVIDAGYGLSVASYEVLTGDKILGDHLNKVIQDVNVAIKHQTDLETTLSTYPKGKLIETTDLALVSAKVDIAYNNRLNVGPSEASIVNSDGYSNGTPWSSSHTYRIRMDWGSNKLFRSWGNLGGFITIGASMTGGSGSNQDASWTNLFQAIGTLVFGAVGGTQINQIRNGTFPNGGLYNILQNGQTGVNASQGFKILANDVNYSANSFIIRIYPYGGADAFTATGFEIEFSLVDTHTATGQGPDVVDGTLGISVNTYYSFDRKPTVTNSGAGLGATLG